MVFGPPKSAILQWHQVELIPGACISDGVSEAHQASIQSRAMSSARIAPSSARTEAGFVGHWRYHEQYHVPLGHDAFDDIEDFLRGFRTMVGI